MIDLQCYASILGAGKKWGNEFAPVRIEDWPIAHTEGEARMKKGLDWRRVKPIEPLDREKRRKLLVSVRSPNPGD